MPNRLVTLRAEIAAILRERGNEWIHAQDIAAAVNAKGRCRHRSGGPVTVFQVLRQTRNYAHIFERQGCSARLRTTVEGPAEGPEGNGGGPGVRLKKAPSKPASIPVEDLTAENDE